MKGIIFKKMGIKDLDLLIRWRRIVLQEVFGTEVDEIILKRTEEMLRKSLEDGSHVSIMAFDSSHKSIASGDICYQEELPSPDNPRGKAALLMNIYVVPERRQEGIGGETIRRLIKEAKKRGAGRIYLEATQEGLNLYRHSGFVEIEGMMEYRDRDELPSNPAPSM